MAGHERDLFFGELPQRTQVRCERLGVGANDRQQVAGDPAAHREQDIGVLAQLGGKLDDDCFGWRGEFFALDSDARLKENVRPSSRGLEALGRIQVRDYNFIGDTRRQQGVLAQELAEVYPDAVSRGGDDPKTKPWSVDYGRLTPLTILAIQELQQAYEAQGRRAGGAPTRSRSAPKPLNLGAARPGLRSRTAGCRPCTTTAFRTTLSGRAHALRCSSATAAFARSRSRPAYPVHALVMLLRAGLHRRPPACLCCSPPTACSWDMSPC